MLTANSSLSSEACQGALEQDCRSGKGAREQPALRLPCPPPPRPLSAVSYFHVLGLCLSGHLNAIAVGRWLVAGLDSFGQVAKVPSFSKDVPTGGTCVVMRGERIPHISDSLC